MPQKDIELILMRQLASCLATPVFLVDPQGNLVFYNEHAEAILGRRFEETGSMPVGLWSTIFSPRDGRGREILPEALPLVIALRKKVPAQKRFWIKSLDGSKKQVEATAFPLMGQTGRLVGAVTMIQEVKG
ncbi:PAS domain-containing protein [Phragmitibacter flavus]|uniref:PAS domain-containing protein n=1 Tax=Phragmitibacter flavus TaxID=2576071 RepID=A0A5R8KBQ6_9BACT|nr:PAS domain-containing protein [Phragmitibacter flavus]TLD69740.1 PAS domain-containing protein [Phragmitibacter flavus]